MAGDIEEFCWGRKIKLVEKPSKIIDFLEIDEGGYSSIHSHNYQDNLMMLIEGHLNINYFNSYKYQIYSTTL